MREANKLRVAVNSTFIDTVVMLGISKRLRFACACGDFFPLATFLCVPGEITFNAGHIHGIAVGGIYDGYEDVLLHADDYEAYTRLIGQIAHRGDN